MKLPKVSWRESLSSDDGRACDERKDEGNVGDVKSFGRITTAMQVMAAKYEKVCEEDETGGE
jgi:hypothetical protein